MDVSLALRLRACACAVIEVHMVYMEVPGEAPAHTGLHRSHNFDNDACVNTEEKFNDAVRTLKKPILSVQVPIHKRLQEPKTLCSPHKFCSRHQYFFQRARLSYVMDVDGVTGRVRPPPNVYPFGPGAVRSSSPCEATSAAKATPNE